MAYPLSFLQYLSSFSKILWCLNWTTRCYTCSVLHTAVAWWKPADSQSWLARRLTAQTLKAWKLNLVVRLINKPRDFLLTPHYKWSLLRFGTLWYHGVQLNFTLSFWIQWAISVVFCRPYCWHWGSQCWKKVPPQFGNSQKYPVLSSSSLFF